MTQAARRAPNAAPPNSSRHYSARVDRGVVPASARESGIVPVSLRESGIVPVAPVALASAAHDIGVVPLRAPRVKLVGPARATKVTLCVFGWQNVQPGPLSWVFPSVGAAVVAAQAMRNAIDWIVVDGPHAPSELEWLRRRGTVLASSSDV